MKKTLMAILGIMIMMTFTLTGCGSSDGADTIITGKIWTGDAENKTVEAVAIKDGEIVYAGDKEGVGEFKAKDTEEIETGEGIAMPGFIDGHSHGQEGGVGELFEVNLMEMESYDEYMKAVEDFVKENKDIDFINGTGWANSVLPSGKSYVEDLDKVCPDVPAVLVSEDHHAYLVNSKFIEKMGDDANKDGVKGIDLDSNGKPTGLYRDDAMNLVDKYVPEYTVDQFKEGILYYQDMAKEFGVTGYYEPMVNLNGSGNILKAYEELDADNKLITKVWGGYQIIPDDNIDEAIEAAKKAMEDNEGGMFEVNSIKLLVDGVVEGHTAYLKEPYADDESDRGEMNFTNEQLKEIVTKAQDAGLIVHAHCIGDGATENMVKVFEEVAKETGKTDCRHAITHLQVVAQDDIKKMAELNIVAVINSYWFQKEPGYFQELETPYLGEERANNEYPEKDFYDAGCVVSIGSDYPVTVPPSPLFAIQTGATRTNPFEPEGSQLNPSQIVGVEELMISATYQGAYQNFAEEKTGSIAEGKAADIIVLDQDITKIDPMKISEAKVLKNYRDGKLIYESK